MGIDLRMNEITKKMVEEQNMALTGDYQFDVCIGIPSRGWLPMEFWLHFNKLIKAMPRGITFNTFIISRKPIGLARSMIFKVAINSNAKYLFIIDDDTIPPLYIVRRMMELADNFNYDAITGLAWPKGGFTRATIYKNFEEAGLPPKKFWNYGDVFPVALAGFPCCLLRIDALKLYWKYMTKLYPERVHAPRNDSEASIPLVVWDGEWFANRGAAKPPQRYEGAEDFYFWYHWNQLGLKCIVDTFCCSDHCEINSGLLYPTQDVIDGLLNEKFRGKRFYQIENPFEAIKPGVEIKHPVAIPRDPINEHIVNVFLNEEQPAISAGQVTEDQMRAAIANQEKANVGNNS